MARKSRTTHPSEFTLLDTLAKAKGETNDCAVKAVALACDVPYDVAHAALREAGRQDKQGTFHWTTRKAIKKLGFKVREWTFKEKQAAIKKYPGVHSKLAYITTHHPRRFPEAWEGCHPNMLWRSARHILSVKDGKVMDWSVNNSLRVVDIWEIEKEVP